MTKRIILAGLMLALLVMAVAPAGVVAYDGGPAGSEATDFTGSGLIYVTYMPNPVIQGNNWLYLGEIVEGFLGTCDWDWLAGAVFWSEHHSNVRISDSGDASGVMQGIFMLARPDGSGTLEGTFTGRIEGNLYTGDISDTGTWQSQRATGVFEDTRAWGKWSAGLHFDTVPGTDIMTLIGPVIWEGKYNAPANQSEANGPAAPGARLKIIKPGKPVKPWQPAIPDKH